MAHMGGPPPGGFNTAMLRQLQMAQQGAQQRPGPGGMPQHMPPPQHHQTHQQQQQQQQSTAQLMAMLGLSQGGAPPQGMR